MSEKKPLRHKAKEKWDLLSFNADFKWDLFRKDKRFFGMYLLEFLLVIVLVIGIYVYLDPSLNLIPFPYDIIGFIFLIAALALIQRFSSYFTLFALGIFVLVFGLMLYFNSEVNLVAYPYNVITFFLIAGIVFFLYNHTSGFRNEWKEFKEIHGQKKN